MDENEDLFWAWLQKTEKLQMPREAKSPKKSNHVTCSHVNFQFCHISQCDLKTLFPLKLYLSSELHKNGPVGYWPCDQRQKHCPDHPPEYTSLLGFNPGLQWRLVRTNTHCLNTQDILVFFFNRPVYLLQQLPLSRRQRREPRSDEIVWTSPMGQSQSYRGK